MKRWVWGTLTLLLCGCASGSVLQAELDAIRAQLEIARSAGVYFCAPLALAKGEAHAEFLANALVRGDAQRAFTHREQAAEYAQAAVHESKNCLPPAVRDTDGDRIPDENDPCPAEAGPVEYLGCPDRDGDGIADIADDCPDIPEDLDGFLDDDGCPEEEDRDADGIVDDRDACPDVPEDLDGFEDADGCPDIDNDQDGIVDAADACRDLAETRNGYLDDDGCPDINPSLVSLNLDLGKIEIKQKVFFATGRAKIRKRSFELLNEVANVLEANPDLRILVEGHTDSRGSQRSNQKLSSNRAKSVRNYLVRRGIETGRLESKGHGESRPIAPNKTRAGRKKNRRVEFSILDEDGNPVKPTETEAAPATETAPATE